jgi:hypothetical protein
MSHMTALSMLLTLLHAEPRTVDTPLGLLVLGQQKSIAPTRMWLKQVIGRRRDEKLHCHDMCACQPFTCASRSSRLLPNQFYHAP